MGHLNLGRHVQLRPIFVTAFGILVLWIPYLDHVRNAVATGNVWANIVQIFPYSIQFFVINSD